MSIQRGLIDFITREWLLFFAGISLVLTSIYSKRLPVYSIPEIEVLFILFTLFVAINGLQRSKLISRISQKLETGNYIALKLVLATFILSMFITNDIALIVIVPVTLTLNMGRKDVLVVFEALAANAGSALTPFGNPQNLFLYWYYDLHITEFVKTIAPFSILFFLLLALSALFIKNKKTQYPMEKEAPIEKKAAYVYGGLFLIVLLIVLHVLPVWAGILIVAYALFFDRKALLVDYSLLISFVFFFGVSENLKILFESEIHQSGHIFMFSALVSQVMSNVPATLLFAKFTKNWEALLWGVNTGGFGSLFGSFANLIAYKIYVSHKSTQKIALFTGKFVLIGYAAFVLSAGLYFGIYGIP